MSFEHTELPDTTHAHGGRHDQNDQGYGLTPVITGDMDSYNVEATTAAAAATFTFKKQMRTVIVYAVNGAWVAKTALAVDTVGTGAKDDRHFIPAGVRVELPWRTDTIAYKATAANGAIYIEGRR